MMNQKLSLYFIIILVAAGLSACGGSSTSTDNTIDLESRPAGNVSQGETLFADKGCVACHSLEPGKVQVGPSIVGVASRSEETIKRSTYTGQATTAKGYLIESIVEPKVYIVEEFDPLMSETIARTLTEEELDDIVEYMLTLK
ncbi:MAG: cytochrome c [Chloroflexota bacterium]